MFRPTNPPIHPPTHQKNTHPWVGNSPQIRNLQTELKYLDSFKSYRVFRGGTPLGGGWVGWDWVGAPPTPVCMCTHTCACTCTHTCMHIKHDKHGCLHGGGHLQFPNMFILVLHACACMRPCLGTPPIAPRCLPTHLPPPQSPREPKSPKVYKS